MQSDCPGFTWVRVDFLPSSWYNAAFWRLPEIIRQYMLSKFNLLTSVLPG